MTLKGDKYETQEEVQLRLENTIVLYDGRPVYITAVNMPREEDGKEVARVYFNFLPNKPDRENKNERRFLSSKKFDLAPFKMGYMNYKNEAVLVSRAPVRQNKQGLSTNSATFFDIFGRRPENINFNALVSSSGFVDMYDGKFPSFQEVGDLFANKDVQSVAASRDFAFVFDHDLEALMLHHRNSRCGLALKGDKALRVAAKYHFLREALEECRIPLA